MEAQHHSLGSRLPAEDMAGSKILQGEMELMEVVEAHPLPLG